MPNESPRAPSGAGGAVACPVCAMEVDPGAAPDSLECRGTTYAFCDSRCRDRFEARPEFFLARRRERACSPVMLG